MENKMHNLPKILQSNVLQTIKKKSNDQRLMISVGYPLTPEVERV